MTLDTSKPVRLRRAPEMVGDVTSVGKDAMCIQFHGGGTGMFKVTDLEQDDPLTAPEDKSWPPRNLERK